MKTETVNKILGFPGRLLSSSKSSYMDRHPKNTVFFNGNMYDSRGEKIWYGDMDITKERDKLEEIARSLGEVIYVTREHPFRWQEQTPQSLQAACQEVDHPTAFVIDP